MFNLNNFKINNIYYYLFIFLGIISILILLYFWRRISNLLNSNDSLEKKNSLLKKELKNLRDNNNNTADSSIPTEMNEIFGNDSDVDIVMHNNMNKNNTGYQDNDKDQEMTPEEMMHHQMMQQQMMQQEMIQQQMMQQQMMQQKIMEEKINSENDNNNDDIEDIVDKIIQPNNEELPNSIETSDVNNSVNLSVKKDNEDNVSIVSGQTNSTTYTKSKLNKLTVDKLKEICINNGGSDEGTKQVLIDRILNEQFK